MALRTFDGAVAFITGGASGIGRALAINLAEAGAEPVELPLIQVLPPEDPGALDDALERRHDWVVFTSVNGVRAVWQRLQAIGADAKSRKAEDPLRPGRRFSCVSCHEPHRSSLPKLGRFEQGVSASCQRCHRM